MIGQCQARHRHQEWLKFLRRLDAAYPADVALHIVMDNDGTDKTAEVQARLALHPRFVCHFVPTRPARQRLESTQPGCTLSRRRKTPTVVAV